MPANMRTLIDQLVHVLLEGVPGLNKFNLALIDGNPKDPVVILPALTFLLQVNNL